MLGLPSWHQTRFGDGLGEHTCEQCPAACRHVRGRLPCPQQRIAAGLGRLPGAASARQPHCMFGQTQIGWCCTAAAPRSAAAHLGASSETQHACRSAGSKTGGSVWTPPGAKAKRHSARYNLHCKGAVRGRMLPGGMIVLPTGEAAQTWYRCATLAPAAQCYSPNPFCVQEATPAHQRGMLRT